MPVLQIGVLKMVSLTTLTRQLILSTIQHETDTNLFFGNYQEVYPGML